MFVQAIGTIDTWLLTISVEKAGIKMKHKYFQVFYQQKNSVFLKFSQQINLLRARLCTTFPHLSANWFIRSRQECLGLVLKNPLRPSLL